MIIDTIHAAIYTHQMWVEGFRQALAGATPLDGDVAAAADDRRCELGQWLNSQSSLEILGDDFHRKIDIFHAMFHDIAGEVALRLQSDKLDVNSVALLGELANLSTQLVALLNMAERRLTHD